MLTLLWLYISYRERALTAYRDRRDGGHNITAVLEAIKAALEGFEESQHLSTLLSSTSESTKDIFQTFSKVRLTVTSCAADHGIVRVALTRVNTATELMISEHVVTVWHRSMPEQLDFDNIHLLITQFPSGSCEKHSVRTYCPWTWGSLRRCFTHSTIALWQ